MSNTRIALLPVFLLAFGAVAGDAYAQTSDVNVFMTRSAAPNIAIVLDTSGSMNDPPASCSTCPDKFVTAKQAVQDLIVQINPPDGVGGYIQNARFGLFGFGNNGGPGADLVVPIGNGNEAAILTAVAGLGNSSVGTPLGAVLTDVGRYYAGTDGWGSLPLYGAFSGESGASPIDADCRQSFVVFMSDGLPNRDKIQKYPYAAHCATIGDSDMDGAEGGCVNDDDWFDDVALKMSIDDFSSLPLTQNIITHVIGFDVDAAILQDAAAHAGGTYQTSSSSQALLDAFVKATEEIFAGTVSFTSATVPSARTAFSDGFFAARFFADTRQPFWEGHLEAFRFSASGEVLDAAGAPALDTATGEFIEPRNPFWSVQERLHDPGHPARQLYTTKAGVRTDFTRATITAADLNLLASDLTAYPTAFATTDALRDAIVDFVYGLDAFDEDLDTVTAEQRVAILGDIFHSNPKVVGPPPPALEFEEGFGPAGTAGTFMNLRQARDRVIYVGANDGLLHAIDAGSFQTGDNPATPETENDYYDLGTGNELFGYAPGVLLDALKQMPINAPKTQWYVDGNPAAADAWLPASALDTTKEGIEWATVLVTGLRQGGAGYLALDVTDPGATGGAHGPYPKLLWEFNDPAQPLAESWSQPVITRVKVAGPSGFGDKCGADDGDGDCREQWVAIFAAGYELAADPNFASYVDTAQAGWTGDAKALFVVALDSGQVLARVAYDPADAQLQNMVYAMPTNPAVLDFDFDGFADLVYAGDLGGQLWKWDLSAVGADGADADTLIDTWPAGVFFRSLPTDLGSGVFHYRSIFFPPTASLVNGDLVLSFGTGERTDLRFPGTAALDENNRFYVVRDQTPTGAGSIPAAPYGESDLSDITNVATDPDPTDLGFYLVADDGEKFISNHIGFGGFLITTSFSPVTTGPVDVCEQFDGESFVYVFDLEFGGGFFGSTAGASAQGRRLSLGGGVAGDPQISTSANGGTKIVIQRSGGEVSAIDGPDGGDDGSFLVYWKEDM